jgi:hypothetical protein
MAMAEEVRFSICEELAARGPQQQGGERRRGAEGLPVEAGDLGAGFGDQSGCS